MFRAILPLLLWADPLTLPAALEAFESHRARIVTANIESANDEYVLYEGQWRQRFRYETARLALQDRIKVNRGDDDGVVIRTVDGQPSVSSALHYLATDRVWSTVEGSGQAQARVVGGNETRVADVRTLGAAAVPTYHGLDRVFCEPGDAPAWREEWDGALMKVTCVESRRERVWWLDPAKDWSIVRTTLGFDGRAPHAESRSTLRQFDGYWFPEKVEYYSSAYQGGREPVESVTVLAFEMNEPWHPLVFTVADIGVSDGTAVALVQDGQQVASGIVSNGAYVDIAEFTGPVAAPAATSGAASTQPARQARAFEALWERYTREFIERHALQDDQRAKALQVLAECQGRAREHLDRTAARLAALERGLRGLDDNEQVRRATLQGTISRLLEPIDRIFEHRLKPRLDSIPTRKQRETAAAATRPS